MVCGAKVVVTGDGFVPGERSVIIMNHRTRMDWMFLWNCLLRYSYLRLEKICLKSSLKSIPGFGWAMQVAAFVFIQRKWEDDKSHFENMLDYFCDIREPLQLLIFPEGTDLTANTKARSNEFAEKNGLQKYEYVLHPRTTGFTFVVERLREGGMAHDRFRSLQNLLFTLMFLLDYRINCEQGYVQEHLRENSNILLRSMEFSWMSSQCVSHLFAVPVHLGISQWKKLWNEDLHDTFCAFSGDNLDAIHDITVAYPQNIPQTEKHLLKGNFPKEIHFHVQRYPIEMVPTSKEELELWCRKRWEEKEERLRHFYEGGKRFSAAGQSIVPPCKSELRVLAVKCASLLYWTVFPLGMLALLYLYSFAQWYFATMIVFFVVQQKIFGGLELIELACHRYFKKQQKFHDMKVKIN
ncbi:hypothetical protein TURU_044455 [Turdus rufiventris]|nr:hypothetical protein TURU_044455 [Turdus rufiventris]